MTETTERGAEDQPGEVSGVLLDEDNFLTLDEVSHACAVQTQFIVELVEEGLITPELAAEPEEPRQWRFTGMHMRHARIALHLQNDLGINLAGVAVALQLLEEVEVLRARLNVVAGGTR
jgi:chaperone modulatory protein CbpM